VNVYAVLHPSGEAAATAFANWLAGDAGRARISGFTIGGKPVFTVPSLNR